MDDVIGFKVRHRQRGWVGFLTYGRLWHPVDEDELLAAIRNNPLTLGKDYDVSEIHICGTLSELQSAPYFYEGLLSFAWRPIPFGRLYEKWRNQMREDFGKGKEIYCVGDLEGAPLAEVARS